jgi:hypothetical protein
MNPAREHPRRKHEVGLAMGPQRGNPCEREPRQGTPGSGPNMWYPWWKPMGNPSRRTRLGEPFWGAKYGGPHWGSSPRGQPLRDANGDPCDTSLWKKLHYPPGTPHWTPLEDHHWGNGTAGTPGETSLGTSLEERRESTWCHLLWAPCWTKLGPPCGTPLGEIICGSPCANTVG